MNELSRGNLIISNFGEDSISLIDTNTGKEIRKIKLYENGQLFPQAKLGPHHMALDKEKKVLYVPNSFNNNLVVVDLVTGVIIDKTFLGSCPTQAIICKKYNSIYIANADSNSVMVLSLDRLDFIAQIPTGEMPHGMAITKDQEKIFVANSGSETITEISTATNEKIKCHRVDCSPWHIRMDNGKGDLLFVVHYGHQFNKVGKILVYDTRDMRLVQRIELGKMPVEVTGDDNNKYIYATDSDLNVVNVFDYMSNKLIHKIPVSKMPHGIEVDLIQNRLFVTSIRQNVVDIIDLSKLEVTCSVLTGKEPTSIVVI